MLPELPVVGCSPDDIAAAAPDLDDYFDPRGELEPPPPAPPPPQPGPDGGVDMGPPLWRAARRRPERALVARPAGLGEPTNEHGVKLTEEEAHLWGIRELEH